jgi:hypothetical protein
MAIAERLDTFGNAHPKTTFLGGLVVGGIGAVLGATLAVAAISDTGPPSSGATSVAASVGQSYLEEADSAARVVLSSTTGAGEDAAIDAELAAPRTPVRPDVASAMAHEEERIALYERSRSREVRLGIGVASTESEEIWREALANEAAAAFAYDTDVSREQSAEAARAALDESLFAGNGVFDDVGLGGTSGAPEAIRSGVVLTDEQEFMLELEYRWQHGIALGGVATVHPAIDMTAPALEWRAGVEG